MVKPEYELCAFIGSDNFESCDLELLALNGKQIIKFPLREPVISFFMRIVCGDPTIKVNLPNTPSEIESGEHDYFSSISASVDAQKPISTRDILISMDTSIAWRITSVEKKEPMSIDVGKEINIRKVREFEAYALIP